MRRNELFYLAEFDSDYFLVPTGQAVAEHKSVITTNAVGAFIWEALEKEMSLEKLTELAVQQYQPTPEELSGLKDDIRVFMESLKVRGLLCGEVLTGERDSKGTGFVDVPSAALTAERLSIAEISIDLFCDVGYLNDELTAFKAPEGTLVPADMEVFVVAGEAPDLSCDRQIISTHTAAICESHDLYVLKYREFKYVNGIFISKDLRRTEIFISGEPSDASAHEVYLALRTPFLLKALERGMVMLHSASILYAGKVFCFSAPSGTGKTTHTNLWKKLYDIDFVNGDLNLLKPGSDSAIVYGTPWCGTSGIFTRDTLPLGGIVFLKQAHINKVTAVSGGERFTKLVSRLITPAWNHDLCGKICSASASLAASVPMWTLECDVSDGAVEAIKAEIDGAAPQ